MRSSSDFGGGRGRRAWNRDGVERQGPLLHEPPRYPNLDAVAKSAALDEASRELVTFNRMFTNYWKNSEFFLSDKESSLRLPGSDESCAAQTDDEAVKVQIIAYTGSGYFPEELQKKSFTGGNLRRVNVTAGRVMSPSSRNTHQQKLKEIEQKEKTEGGNEREGGQKEESKEAKDEDDPEHTHLQDEPDDFGGEDYAHDYYADEEADDGFDDGDDGGFF